MLTRETITVGRQRFRIAPWHTHDGVGLLSVPADQPHPSAAAVASALEKVRSRGYTQIMTSALAEADSAAFFELGFTEHDRLGVLEHRLDEGTRPQPSPGNGSRPEMASTPELKLRRGRRSDRRAALELDHRAFQPFWRLDADGLADAKSATPTARFRIAELNGTAVGYSVTGKGGTSGFLQRIATDPEHQRKGIASAMVTDALRWCARRGCDRVLVNTQVTNAAALALYRRLGFIRLTEDLVVLSWSLG